ncbi:DUF1446 domain protein [Plectosphaerella plurivora]|uniref:DUF1446 domain protein n=1 Tax=Plectosphaerella plurivora TaxID=936078 RepID=A0A9P8VE61_9PEZI|nr:DUF1446 domain protein [Plectosphaerella plurivora]
MLEKPPLRVGNVSGATGDHPRAMERMVRSGNVQVITGDWLSEMNIAWNAITRRDVDPELGYEQGFFDQLEVCLDDIMTNDIRVVVNAGALNTESLFRKVKELCKAKGYPPDVVAAIYGDDVSGLLNTGDPANRMPNGLSFPHLDHPELTLDKWGFTPLSGNAYIGCWGIVKALRSGARIVLCGRCTDASPDQYDELAGSLLAAHLIECGPYVVGANFSGFKDFLPDLVDLAFPIAEIQRDGTCFITKTSEGGGRVTRGTVTAQLLYELQGHLYLNPDVVADLHNVRVEEVGRSSCQDDRVRVFNVKGLPPPPTTKVMFTAEGGYQAEAMFYINGLDVHEKVAMMKNQLRHFFKDSNFSRLSIEQYGSQVANPFSQQAGTVMLRVFAQARELSNIVALKFKTPIYAVRMQSYPGYHMSLDFRTMDPKPFMEMFPALIPQSVIQHRVELGSGEVLAVDAPSKTAIYPIKRPTADTQDPIDLLSLGETDFVPLGSIVHARSGDKADNSNVGFFVRHDDEYDWLRSALTTTKLKQLFGDDWFKSNPDRRVERIEFPGINAVHL